MQFSTAALRQVVIPMPLYSIYLTICRNIRFFQLSPPAQSVFLDYDINKFYVAHMQKGIIQLFQVVFRNNTHKVINS